MKCFVCNKKISLALSMSISKCECENIFCSLHKETHTSTCEKYKEKQEKNKQILSSSLLNIKSVDSGNLQGRI